jgi:CRISPR-associated protein Csa3
MSYRKKVFIITLGFDEKFALRCLFRNGVEEGDRVILLASSDDNRVKSAFENVRRIVEKTFEGEIKVELEKVNVRNFTEAVKYVKKIIDACGSSSIVLNLSGGMRALVITAFMSCLLSESKSVKVEVELEDFSGVVEIPASIPGSFKSIARLSKEEREIVEKLKEKPSSAKELSKLLGKDESTIRRSLYRLEELCVVRRIPGWPARVELTEIGRLLA